MISKRIFLILCVSIMFVSILGVCAADYENITPDLQHILDNTDESDLTGCCSVVLQLDGNNSIMSFRRDSKSAADIFIEEIDWHGTPAIKQYKTDGDYFCQVIITSDGWTIGYGGKDDGIDNKRIENITAGMINDNNSISNKSLSEIQAIKKEYKLGHVLIKAPNGNYGIATAYSHFTGKLSPGEYVSIPNSQSFFRSGTVPLNTTDKISAMTELAASDGFGLTRRDITTFYYHNVQNSSFKGNVTEAFVSNDDGSLFGMSTGDLVDNVYFNNTLFKADDIPISPNYEPMGNMVFKEPQSVSKLLILTVLVGVVIFVAILSIIVYRIVRSVRYKLR